VAPSLPGGDRLGDGGGVSAVIDPAAGDDLPGPLAIAAGDGELVVVVGIDTGFLEGGSDDRGPVRLVLGQGLARPPAR
jgi:hypothetical protein